MIKQSVRRQNRRLKRCGRKLRKKIDNRIKFICERTSPTLLQPTHAKTNSTTLWYNRTLFFKWPPSFVSIHKFITATIIRALCTCTIALLQWEMYNSRFWVKFELLGETQPCSQDVRGWPRSNSFILRAHTRTHTHSCKHKTSIYLPRQQLSRNGCLVIHVSSSVS